MICRACNHDHSPLLRCEVARRQREAATNSDATNTVATNTLNRRKREDYNAYQREFMRKHRAKKKAKANA